MIEITKLAEQHIEGFHKVLDEVAREKQYLILTQAPSLAKTKEFALKNIKNNHINLVALDTEIVIAWCDIMPFEHEVLRHVATLGMGISKKYRHQGLGKRLLARALSMVEDRKIERVELGVLAHNTNAIALYKKFGFVEEGIKRRRLKIDQNYYDEILMARMLDL